MSVKKVLNQRIQRIKSRFTPRSVSIKEFHAKRNKVLIIREVGGLGDIFMHRMMFEDMKDLMPDSEIIFACPKQYISAVTDHPYVDQVVDYKIIDANDYLLSYNTTFICGRYEMSIAPLADKNRSDIWANHCGVELTKHNMHIKLTKDEIEYGNKIVNQFRVENRPVVLISPVSAMIGKNLSVSQVKMIGDKLKEIGCTYFLMHLAPLPIDTISTICNVNIRQWMSIINASDYVVSVDTSTFHCAGGLKKPLTGIFTFACGKTYGKFYNFELVQKHRDNGDWDCGPCYNWSLCPKTNDHRKPCLTEITDDMIVDGIYRMFRRWQWNKIKLKIPYLLNIIG